MYAQCADKPAEVLYRMSEQRKNKNRFEAPVVTSTQLQIRIREDLKGDFQIAARLKGLTTSALIHSLIVKAVHEAKEEQPEAFGLGTPADAASTDPLIREILWEGFGSDPIDPEILRHAIQVVKAAKIAEGKEFRPPASNFKRKKPPTKK